MGSDSAEDIWDNGKLWGRFCDRLRDGLDTLNRDRAPRSAFDQAEGTRYLSRLVRLGLEIYLESGDPEFPSFYKPSHETAKIGGDNPDNLYLSSTISGKHSYRLTGNVGTVAYLSLGSKANRYAVDGSMPSTGELAREGFLPDDHGNFSIIASVEKPVTGEAWLSLADDSSMLHLRQTFLERDREIPATIAIERISAGPDVPAPVNPDLIAQRLMAAADFVVNSSAQFVRWAELFMTAPNELRDWGQEMFIKGGGDPQIFYVHGYWALDENEALVIETPVPGCEHWNIQINNWWMESLDYRYHEVCINKHNARLNPDGTVTVVIAHRDPGFGNWLPTVGHRQGFVLLRWVRADSHPVPASRVVELPRA